MTEKNNNWVNADKLNRKASADFLSSYLIKRYTLAKTQHHSDSLVMNIRANWGHGKTFFLERWAKDLEDLNHPVVFFDAWANDFSDDPLVGFISEIDQCLSKHFSKMPLAKRQLDNALATGRKLIKPVGMAIASVLAKKMAGYSLEELSELFSSEATDDDSAGEEADDDDETSENKTSKDISKLAELALKEHLSKKETIKLFKNRLQRLVRHLESEPNVQLPIFIYIDELDRCRPNYAIELLEAVKHLFGVPGIYFIVATNLEQLGHSIRSVYGEQFDSERYLKRFFDQEYLLPEPELNKFVALLFEKYPLPNLDKIYCVIEPGLYDPIHPTQAMFQCLADAFKLSLRDQEQVAAALQATLLTWPEHERPHFSYLLFLIILKQLSTATFKEFAENRFSDHQKFQLLLTPLLRMESTFKTFDKIRGHDTWNARRPADCKVSEMLWTYQSILSQNIRDLMKRDSDPVAFPDKIVSAICNDAPQSWPANEEPRSPLTSYAQRVAQAGQLVTRSR